MRLAIAPDEEDALLKIIGGSSSDALAAKVSRALGTESAKMEIKKFPDGEKYLRVVEEVKGENVIVI